MIDWGEETKPRPQHSGRLGMDAILKDARRGDLRAVQAHLRRDPSLITSKSGGHNRTFLWEATRGNQPGLVKYLLQEGADANVPGRVRAEITVLTKPLSIAWRYRHPQLVKLLDAVTTVDIFSACFMGDIALVRRLLDEDPALLTSEQDDESVWRVTPLHHAIAGGHEELARFLIDQGAKVKPYTRLLCNTASRIKREDLMRLLLAGGADKELARVWGQPRLTR